MEWLSANIGSIIVFLIIVLIVGCIIWKMVRDKAAGRSSCGCKCANCPSAGVCHSKMKKPSGK